MHGLSKIQKQELDGCPLFRPILPALQTVTYNLAKFLVSTLNPLTKSEYTVKDVFHFAKEVRKQGPSLSMGSLHIDSLFTNITLHKLLIFLSISYLKTLILLKVLKSQNLSYYVWLQRTPALNLMIYFTSKLMVCYWDYFLDLHLLTHFCYTMRNTG